ncbi:MAG: hypothetical protein HYZ93_06620 [Candidatus Omnitrophica bacterium]|nr:hypothetical protein [Candidatus Omnitrophota bacterium]
MDLIQIASSVAEERVAEIEGELTIIRESSILMSAGFGKDAEKELGEARKKRDDLRRFAQLPPADQQKILEVAVRTLQGSLQEAFEKAEPYLEAEIGRLDHIAKQERNAWERDQLREASRRSRAAIQHLNPRVPPGAIFVALVPAANSSGERGLADDWVLVEEAVGRDPELQGLTLLRFQLLPGEDAVERAKEIAGEYAQPGRQLTVGIALGVLPEERAKELDQLWPSDSIRTDHPLLAASFIYTPARELDRLRKEGRFPLPSVSGQFRAWVNRGGVGLIVALPELELPSKLWPIFEERLRRQAGLEEDLSRREFFLRSAAGVIAGGADWSRFLKDELERVFLPEQITVDRQKTAEAVVNVLGLAMDWKHYELRDLLRNPSGRLVLAERLERLWWVKGQEKSFSPDPMLFPGFSASGFLGPFREYARLMDGWVRSAERQDPRQAILAQGNFVEKAFDPLRSHWSIHEPEESRQGDMAGFLVHLSELMRRRSQGVLDLKIEEKAAHRDIQLQEGVVARYREMAARMRQLTQLPREEQNKFLLAGIRTKQREFGEMLRRAEPLARRWAGRLQEYWRRNLRREWGRTRQAVQEYPEFIRSVRPRVGSGAVFVGLFPDRDDFLAETERIDDWPLLVRLQKERQWEVRLVREELPEFGDPVRRAAEIASEMAESGFEGQVGIVLGVLSHDQAEDLMNLERIYEELHSAHPGFTASFIFTFEEALQRAWREDVRSFASWGGWFSAWASDPVPGIMHVLPGLVLPTELREWFEEQMQTQAGLEQAA